MSKNLTTNYRKMYRIYQCALCFCNKCGEHSYGHVIHSIGVLKEMFSALLKMRERRHPDPPDALWELTARQPEVTVKTNPLM